MAKTRKIMDICEGGVWLVCIKDQTGKINPYKLYQKSYDPAVGYRQKMLGRYADFLSVIAVVRSIYTAIDAMK